MRSIMSIIEGNAPISIEQFIKTELDEWKRSEALKLMTTGRAYYRGDHKIQNRKRLVIGEGGALMENKNLANRKLVHTFIRKLVDQKVGYLLSKQPSIQTEKDEYAAVLNDVFDKSFFRLLKNIGKDAVNAGIAWLQVYYDEDGRLAFKRHRPEEIIPLWRDVDHTELDAVIRFYEVDAFIGTAKRTITKVEWWDLDGVRRYTLGAPGATVGTPGLVPDEDNPESAHLVVQIGEDQQGFNWTRVPFVPFKYNDDELPLIKVLQSLVDEYDEQTSDNANNIADLPNSVLVLRNYDGQDLGEFRHNLSVFRVVKVGDEGGVDSLEVNLNPEALEKHLDRLRKDIYEFGRGVDTQSDEFGSSPSGVALRFLFSDLDMDANDIENEFQAALEKLLWFVDQHIANTTGVDFSDEPVDFIFNRDIMINETESVNNVKSSIGIVSDETLVANHPFVTDAAEEMKRLEKQRQEALKDSDYTGLEGGGNSGEGGAE